MNKLEDKILIYHKYMTPDLLGEVIFKITLNYNPSEITLIPDDLSKDYPIKYSIYIPKKDYKLSEDMYGKPRK